MKKLYRSKISYTEPAISYFDGPLEDAGKTTITAFPVAIGLGLIAAVATSARGSQNTLERRVNV